MLPLYSPWVSLPNHNSFPARNDYYPDFSRNHFLSLLYSLFNMYLILNSIWNYIVCIPLDFSSFARYHIFKIYAYCSYSCCSLIHCCRTFIVWIWDNLFSSLLLRDTWVESNFELFQAMLCSCNTFCMSILTYVYTVSLTIHLWVASLGHSKCLPSNLTTQCPLVPKWLNKFIYHQQCKFFHYNFKISN